MAQHFKVEFAEIAVVRFFRQDIDANALNESVLLELDAVLTDISKHSEVRGVVFISDRPKQFIAGADIAQIEKMDTAAKATEGASRMQAIFNKLAAFPIPTVAAIHGACLGGGLEFALACKWRVASDDDSTSLGLPEIQLGLIPGAGGTQRLPRLIGLQTSLDLILTGKRLRADKALKVGVVDAVVNVNNLLSVAKDFAHKPKRTPRKSKWMEVLLEHNPVGRWVMRCQASAMVVKNTKGFYPAAPKALSVIFDGFSASLHRGLEIEAQAFGDLSTTSVSKSLIHLFHATTAVKKHPYKDACEKRFANEPIKSVGIIGAGFMGTGIAVVTTDKGMRVRLSDPSKVALGKSLAHLRKFFTKKLKRKQIKAFDVDKKVSMLSPGTSPQGLSQCDFVVEAVFEDLNLKQKLITECEKGVSSNWFFASNTSALPIAKIAAVSKHPERVCGMHFFSPVEKMPLLEIIRTDQTADWVLGRAVEYGQLLGKQVIVVKDGPGFYTTRALAFFLSEAALMFAEGIAIESIDRALTKFGFPVGPITLIDEVGIDVSSHVLETMADAFPDRIQLPAGLDKVIKSGRLGRKNQKGFYKYHDGNKMGPDEEVYSVFGAAAKGSSTLSDQEIVDRCLYVFVNESIRCMREGILATEYDGDVGAVFGLGFPPFLGGPFHFAKTLGESALRARLSTLNAKYGKRFEWVG